MSTVDNSSILQGIDNSFDKNEKQDFFENDNKCVSMWDPMLSSISPVHQHSPSSMSSFSSSSTFEGCFDMTL